jgi:RNA polymerase sigma-70 factor, ECF subfamily
MSTAAGGTPHSPCLPAVDAPGPLIELVTGTGSRELAVLIYRSAGADEPAPAALYDATSPRVYGLAVRILRSPTTAEEGAQASYLEVWRSSTSFDADRSSAMAWIMAIAHRRAVDRLRSDHSAIHPTRGLPIKPLGRRAARNARRKDRATSTEARQVRDAHGRLNPEQREALELVYFDGYTGVEPADLRVILTTLVNASLPTEPIGREVTGLGAPEGPGTVIKTDSASSQAGD